MRTIQDNNNATKRLKERLKYNLEEFGKVICPHLLTDKTPSFHKEMYRALERNAYGDDKYKKLAFIVFRGGAKSTVAITINYLWRIAYDLEKYCWIIAESQGQAIERLHDIKNELEHNERFIQLYGNFQTDKWSEQIIVTQNPRTGHRQKIVSRGIKQRMRGGLFEGSRLTLVSMDDFESEDNTETAEIRDKLVKRLFAIIRPVSDPKERKMILTGTVVHEDAYLNKVLSRHRSGKNSGYRTVAYEIEKDGSRDGSKPIWPERFSTKWIREEYADFARDGKRSLFYQEYYNEAVAPEERPFPESKMKFWDGHFDKTRGAIVINDMYHPVNVYIGVDVAMGKKKGDFSSLTAIAVTNNNNRYVDRIYNKRIQPFDLIEELFRWNEYYTSPFGKPRFFIEVVAMQELLWSWLSEEEKRRNIFLLKEPIQVKQGKDGENSRFLQMQPIYEAGIIYFKKDQHELISQLTRWGPNIQLKNDDQIDSFQLALMNSRPCSRIVVEPKVQKELYRKEYNWGVL